MKPYENAKCLMASHDQKVQYFLHKYMQGDVFIEIEERKHDFNALSKIAQ